MVLVVTLTVRRGRFDEFRAFEQAAARIMRRYGGEIERTVFIPPAEAAPTFKEVHLVRFPDATAFAGYRQDPELAEVFRLREESVVATDILVGVDGPEYGAGT